MKSNHERLCDKIESARLSNEQSQSKHEEESKIIRERKTTNQKQVRERSISIMKA